MLKFLRWTLLALTCAAALYMYCVATTPRAHGATRNACARHPACRARVFARWDRERAHRRQVALERHPFVTVTASWYGPGLYGNRTACGQTLTAGLAGVAHKTLRCGTVLVLCARRCARAAVIDRGPYVAGREFDLTAATRAAIGAAPLGLVRYRLAG